MNKLFVLSDGNNCEMQLWHISLEYSLKISLPVYFMLYVSYIMANIRQNVSLGASDK